MTKYTIVVPIYNVEKEIRQCLESIQEQTFPDFEVICVDDCGKDNSMQIVEEFAQKDNRFKIIHHKENQGLSGARNSALEIATGEYVWFVDSDDWVETKALEILNDIFERHKCDAVHFSNYGVDDKKKEKIRTYVTEKEIVKYANAYNLYELSGVVWNKIYKTEHIRRLNLTFGARLRVEDWDFNFRYFMHVKKVVYSPEKLYNYRTVREGSITTADGIVNDRIRDEIYVLNHIYDYICEQNIFNEYKYYLVKMIGSTVKKILFIQHDRHYIISEVYKLLKRMDFPNGYEDMQYAQTLTFIPTAN